MLTKLIVILIYRYKRWRYLCNLERRCNEVLATKPRSLNCGNDPLWGLHDGPPPMP